MVRVMEEANAQDIVRWLDSKPEDPAPLIQWLQGYSMPPLQSGVEPYQALEGWLGGDRRLASRKDRLGSLLAKIVAAIVDGGLLNDIEFLGEFLCNVGMFCAFVGRPKHLAAPLERLVNECEHAGNWGDEQKQAFRFAVQHNDDGRFKPMWRRMAEEGQHPFWGSDLRDAVRGLLWTPLVSADQADESASGYPDWDALGPTFAHYADSIEGDRKGRRLAFRSLL